MTELELTDKINAYFGHLDTSAVEPLYQQLHGCVSKYIDEHPDNTFFPGERQIAQTLRINRGTVRRALEPFVRSKQLRRTVKGTVIQKKKAPASGPASPLDTVHPLTLGVSMPAMRKKTRIRVRLYENLPDQIVFWQQAAEVFGRHHRHAEIDLKWVEFQGGSPTEYFGYRDVLRDPDAGDLVQLPVFRLWYENLGELFAPLSPRIRSRLDRPDCRARAIAEFEPSLLERCVPVNFSMKSFLANAAYMEPARTGGGALCASLEDGLLARVADALPPDVDFCEHFLFLVEAMGCHPVFDAAARERFLKTLLPLFRRLWERYGAVWPASLDMNSYAHYRTPERFFDGRMFMTLRQSSVVSLLAGRCPFATRPLLLEPAEGFFSPAHLNLFGMGRNRPHPEWVEDFLLFLLSEEQQMAMCRQTAMLPLCRGADAECEKALGLPPGRAARLFDRCREIGLALPAHHDLAEALWRRMSELADGRDAAGMVRELAAREPRNAKAAEA